MGSLFQPTIIEYRLPDGSTRTPDGQRVTKATPGAVRHKTKSPIWWGKYRDASGKRHQVRFTKKKTESNNMLKQLEGEAQRTRYGLADPFGAHLARPLAEHLDDFERFLAAKGNVPLHVQKTCSQCRAIISGCHFERFEDVQPSAVVEFLAGLREDSPVVLAGQRDYYNVAEVADLLKMSVGSVRRAEKRGSLSGGEGRGLKRCYPREAVETFIRQRSRGIGIETSNHYLIAFKSFLQWMVKDRW